MKKYLLPVLISLILGIGMAYFIIKQYEEMPSLAVSSEAETLYYIQRGVYSDMDNMKNNMKEFTHYIYNVEDNQYYTYIGITSNKENALKIQNYYKSIGYDTFLKDKITDNKNFISILKQYDELLSKTDDNESIKVICNQVLAKYEELVKWMWELKTFQS